MMYYPHGDRQRTMRVTAEVFLRRFPSPIGDGNNCYHSTGGNRGEFGSKSADLSVTDAKPSSTGLCPYCGRHFVKAIQSRAFFGTLP